MATHSAEAATGSQVQPRWLDSSFSGVRLGYALADLRPERQEGALVHNPVFDDLELHPSVRKFVLRTVSLLGSVDPDKIDNRWSYFAPEDPNKLQIVRHSIVLESRKPGLVVVRVTPPEDDILRFKYKNIDHITTDEDLPHLRDRIAANDGDLLRFVIVNPELVEDKKADYKSLVEETHADLVPSFGGGPMAWFGQRSSWRAINVDGVAHVYVKKPNQSETEEIWKVAAYANQNGSAYFYRSTGGARARS